jgi:hypothetical protein
MTGAQVTDDKPARIAFYDAWVPSLADGEYEIRMAQKLAVDTAKTGRDGGNPAVDATPQAPAAQRFIVRGPRFAIDPAEVRRTFPPPGAAGAYDALLPTVVFNRRALPWERRLPGAERYPWMALLVFVDGQLLTPGGPSPPGQTSAVAMPLAEALAPTKGTLTPAIELEDDEDPREINCSVIEVTAGTFALLAPVMDDARLLCHVRQTTTDYKESDPAVAEGWVSAVVANRFPLAPPDSGERRNIVHLVSLEGLQDQLTGDAPALPTGCERVRMISLYSWTFSCLADPQVNFRNLMLHIGSFDSERGTGYLLRVPPPAWARTEPEDGPMATAWARLHEGYAPLPYGTHCGERTYAWYRGPLTPVPVQPFFEATHDTQPAHRGPPLSASEAMVYESSSGLFDLSYATAWQVGLALALASLPFATTLLQLRRAAHAIVDGLVERQLSPLPHVRAEVRAALAAGNTHPEVGAEALRRTLRMSPGPQALGSFFAAGPGRAVADALRLTSNTDVADPARPPQARPRETASPAHAAALMEQPAILELLQPTLDDTAVQQVVDWLGRKLLLYDVPFEYLVPDEGMLPIESIRFFYIDQNWIDALFDGALSVGIQSSRDSMLHRIVRDRLRTTVAARHGEPVGGFLLRSAVVSGWPGLEVRARLTPQATPMQPLRLERVAPTTMLGLYADLPTWVEFDEPAEGLVFGPEDDGFAIRYLPGMPGANPSNIGGQVDPPVRLSLQEIAAVRRGDTTNPGALRISDGLADALQAKTPGGPKLEPASLALTLLRAPERMVFQASPPT